MLQEERVHIELKAIVQEERDECLEAFGNSKNCLESLGIARNDGIPRKGGKYQIRDIEMFLRNGESETFI